MIVKYIIISAIAVYSLIPSSSVEAADFGSSIFTSQRSCSQVSATELCDGRGPGQGAISSFFGGGSGIFGPLNVRYNQDSFANASAAAAFFANAPRLGFPFISINTGSASDERISITALSFQAFTYKGSAPERFSLAGQFANIDSSSNPADGALPGGGIFTQFFNVVRPDFFDTNGSVFDLFNDLRSGFCGADGVLGDGFDQGALTSGGQSVTTSLSACSPTSLILSPGQQFIVIGGLQIATNRGGFAEAASFGIRLGDDLTDAQRLNFSNNLVPGFITTVPEPATWAMMLIGFGLIGGGLRSRTAVRKRQTVLA
jgi:PEP-CTERM motif